MHRVCLLAESAAGRPARNLRAGGGSPSAKGVEGSAARAPRGTPRRRSPNSLNWRVEPACNPHGMALYGLTRLRAA